MLRALLTEVPFTNIYWASCDLGRIRYWEGKSKEDAVLLCRSPSSMTATPPWRVHDPPSSSRERTHKLIECYLLTAGKKQRRMLSSSNSHSKRILRFTLLFSLPYHLRGVDSHSRGGKVRKTYPATTAPLPRLLLCGSSPVGRWRGNINDEVPTWEMPVYLTLKNM